MQQAEATPEDISFQEFLSDEKEPVFSEMRVSCNRYQTSSTANSWQLMGGNIKVQIH